MSEEILELLQHVKFPVYFDEGSGIVLDQDGKFICEVRGWGWIQKLSNPEKKQDDLGRTIAILFNTFHVK